MTVTDTMTSSKPTCLITVTKSGIEKVTAIKPVQQGMHIIFNTRHVDTDEPSYRQNFIPNNQSHTHRFTK